MKSKAGSKFAKSTRWLAVLVALCLVAAILTTVFLLLDDNSDMEKPDLSNVTWAHAVNSKELLDRWLNSPVDMLEADVQMGHLQDDTSGSKPYPIMAHPPNITSDITLEQWLMTISSRGSKKGIKLDCKSIDVVEPSLKILKSIQDTFSNDVWWNADILKGPILDNNHHPNPVDPEKFLKLIDSYFPNSVLSVGFTTYIPPNYDGRGEYTEEMVSQLVNLLGSYQQKVTIPVRALFASNSIEVLSKFTKMRSGNTLTVWSAISDTDLVDVNDLVNLQRTAGIDKVYYDLPPDLDKLFREAKGSK